MVKNITFLVFGFFLSANFPAILQGQTNLLTEPSTLAYNRATPAHMWEFGIHTGIPLALGDVDFVPGIGGGVHIRRALDYVFSLRSELLLGQLKNEDTNDGSTETSWQGGTFEVIASLNNLVWSNSKNRKTNFYGLVGVGLNRFKVDVFTSISPEIRTKEFSLQSHGGVGLGFSVRITDRFNIGAETKAWVLFGRDNDRLDAVERQEGDVLSYSCIRLNFNIGNKEKKAEPLYWVNPMDHILQDVSELKNRPTFDLTDTDGDGVIDLLDQDNATPPGIQVDTRGLPLDSDGDGIPNHEDIQPFIPSNNNGETIIEPVATEADIDRIIAQRLAEYDRTGVVTQPGNEFKGGATDPMNGITDSKTATERSRPNHNTMANWFLPLIHFEIDSDQLRYVDYGSLSAIAKMMANDPNLRLTVIGFTDKTASPEYNKILSYNRAKAAIEHLVNTYSIDRDRFVLQYNGEDHPLVPSTGSNLMNRRVEFRVAHPDDREMDTPVPVSIKKKRKGY